MVALKQLTKRKFYYYRSKNYPTVQVHVNNNGVVIAPFLDSANKAF